MLTGATAKVVQHMWTLLMPWHNPRLEAARQRRTAALIARAELARIAYVEATQAMHRP